MPKRPITETWSRIITGDDTGLVKVVAIKKDGEEDQANHKILQTLGSQAKDNAVISLLTCGADLLTVTRATVIELWNFVSAELIHSAPVQALPVFVTMTAAETDVPEELLVVLADGSILQFAKWVSDDRVVLSSRLPLNGEIVSVVTSELGLFVALKENPCPVLLTMEAIEESSSNTFPYQFAQSWTAKNQPDSNLSIRSRFNITAMCYLSPYLIAVDTEGKLRAYNSTLQRRAMLEIPNVFAKASGHYSASDANIRKRPATCIAVKDGQVIVGDTMGSLVEVDVVKMIGHSGTMSKGKSVNACLTAPQKAAKQSAGVMRGYRGVMGSVREVAVDEEDDGLYVVSAGRFLYRFDSRRGPAVKVFLKQKLTAVVTCGDVEVEGGEWEDREEEMEEEMEDEEEQDEGLGGVLIEEDEDEDEDVDEAEEDEEADDQENSEDEEEDDQENSEDDSDATSQEGSSKDESD